MASPSNQDRIKAAKKALDESKSLYQKAEAQYTKAEALYNKAKVQANAIKALSPTLPNISSPAAIAALGTAAITALANNATPEQRAKTINDRKEAIRKIERKAEQELEKAKKAVEGAKKQIDKIKEQLGILTAERPLKEKKDVNRIKERLKVKKDSVKIKLNKAKIKKALKQIIRSQGPAAIVLVFGFILSNQVNKLSQTVSKLNELVDKTNNIIRNATTKADLEKAKIARDAALVSLKSAEDQVNRFNRTIRSISTTLTILSLTISVLTAIPYTPYQISPIGIKTTRTIAKYAPVVISLNILLQIALGTLSRFKATIQYERSRLLPLGKILDDPNITPQEARDLLETSGVGLDGGLGPVLGVEYNGFTFSILEEDDPRFIVAGNKRRFAVALDRSGFIALRSEPSFTLDPEVLIDELKLEIDKRRLEA
jgi:tetratricopeptide (TPR) repeat protein